MKLYLLKLIALVAAIVGALRIQFATRPHARPWPGGFCTANAEGTTGTTETTKTKLTSAAITTRYLLYKQGADADHIAVTDATTPALGTCGDEASAAEEIVQLLLLGKGPTKKMVASEAITLGTHRLVYQAAGGKVAATGHIAVGVPLTGATADGDVIEVADFPAKLLRSLIATAVAAAGTTVADAGQLGNADVVFITSDGAAKGVKLPTGVAGMQITVVNNSGTAAELYAATGGTVNGLAANASVVVPASKGLLCICTAADTWTAFDLTAKATAS